MQIVRFMHVTCVPHLHDMPISERHSTRHFKGEKHLSELLFVFLSALDMVHVSIACVTVNVDNTLMSTLTEKSQ